MSIQEFNKVLNQKEARSAVRDGINIAVDLISPTLGAKSRRIIIDKEYGDMDASDDGTTILDAIKLEDTEKQQGVKVVQECSQRTNTDEGDGTTTTGIILRELVNELLKEDSQKELLFKKDSGSNLKVRKELMVGLNKVVGYINANKIEITSKEQLKQIGTVSSNSEEIGSMLADIFDKLGKDGAVSIQDGNTPETSYEVISGMSLDQGWLAQQFVTDIDREEAILEPNQSGNVNILVTNNKLQDISHIQKIGELFNTGINDLLIIADDITGIPLNSLIANKMHQVVRVVAVKAPVSGNQQELLEDICTVTGATLIGSIDGPKFEELKPEHLGKAKRVVVSAKRTIIVGDGREDEVKERIKLLEGRIEREQSDYEKKKLSERISKLSGGVGSIKVGGSTPLEVKGIKSKITDAVAATKSALRGGVVAGGGVALFLASDILDESKMGEAILKKAITKPFEQIMENSDMDIEKSKAIVLESGNGYNVETEEWGNMIEMGVLDPANVVSASVINSISSAIMVSNLGGSLANIRKLDKSENERN